MLQETRVPDSRGHLAVRSNSGQLLRRVWKYRSLYLMLSPAVLFYLLFHYIPMYGVRIAFYDYGVLGIKGFIGFENYRYLFASSRFFIALRNTLLISGYNLLLAMLFNIGVALLLNEIYSPLLKSLMQTIIYLPHFLSWVVVASIFTMLLAPQTGIINAILIKLGIEPVYFLVSEHWWRKAFIFICRWKETGWGTIIYLAALTGIDPHLYEAATIDGAGRLRQTWHITLPGLETTILIVFIMSLSRILNVFQQVFVLYNPLVYKVADVIGTYTYRIGFEQADYDYATAVGLFKSLISLILVLSANYLSVKIRKQSIL